MLTILDKKLKVLPTLCQSPLGWLPLHHYEIAGGIHYVTMLCGWTRDYRVHIQLKRTPSPKSANPVISGRETARWAKLKLAKLPHKHTLHSSECQVLLNHTYHCYRLRKKKKKPTHASSLFPAQNESYHRGNAWLFTSAVFLLWVSCCKHCKTSQKVSPGKSHLHILIWQKKKKGLPDHSASPLPSFFSWQLEMGTSCNLPLSMPILVMSSKIIQTAWQLKGQ